MAEVVKTGLLDLEKELTCSICTEVLYQPLTLLDCLHTFCGSCLKEWFSFEATRAKPSKPDPFTCPSCRTSVRETRPDAKVTTLLEMFLQANPSQARTEEEKAELKKRYTPGENVMPKVKLKKESREEAVDRRMVEEARDLSLRDVGIRGGTSYERGISHRSRDGGSDARISVPAHTSRDHSRRRERDGTGADARAQARQIEHQSSLRSLLSSSDVDSAEREEEILRQIIDDGILDGIDLTNIDGSQEDELGEKIAEAYRRRHGGGDRPRSRDNRGERSRRTPDRDRTPPPQERPPRTRESRPSQASETPTHSSHPPLSRPHLLEAYPVGPVTRHRRTTSETRRQTSPDFGRTSRASSDIPRQAARSATDISTRAETQRQAARSATDISSRTESQRQASRSVTDVSSRTQRSSEDAQARPREFSVNARRTTDSDRLHPRRASHGTESRRPVLSRSPNGRSRETSSSSRPIAIGNVVVPPPASPRILQNLEPRPGTHNAQQGATARNRSMPSPRQGPAPSMSSPRLVSAPSIPSPRSVATPLMSVQEPRKLYPEPSIACNRCGKANLEYELHKNCSICNDGNYDLCLRCYRLGRGCLHWFGFGHAALQRFERQAPPTGDPTSYPDPHRLKGRKYLPPPPESRPAPHNNVSYWDPASRLQSGPFCSNCSNFAPDCYWTCATCNEGEFGFCNPCVNRGDCCTHPLLPVAQASYLAAHPNQSPSSQQNKSTSTSFVPVPTTSPASTTLAQQTDSLFPSEEFTNLTISIKCDICTYPIPPSTTRFHCPHCSAGDYDICTSCYLRLVNRGTITTDNGPNGWRRCPQGHRMIVVGFEDSALGQRRVVSKDLVGGRALKDEEPVTHGDEWSWRDDGQQRGKKTVRVNATPAASAPSLLTDSHGGPHPASSSPPTLLKQYPPNGGVGTHVQALWSYWPAEGVVDELAFPKGAEVRECEDINGDWYWGIYCGRRGLFPGNYGRVVGGGSVGGGALMQA